MVCPPHGNAAPLLVIVGPTAGGKSAMALELARRLGGECISADSMQVYRGMDIGTAKPTAEERAAVPHHLLDLVDPADERFTVDRWHALATDAIAAVRSRGRAPIVVGGTNLYVRALLEGLLDGPEPDAAVREALQATPLETLRAELEAADPEAAARIHPNDRRRTVRALEVFRQTGTPISALQTQWSADVRSNVRDDAIVVGLDWPVDAINRRINARVRSMMDAGLLEEVRRLRDAGPIGRQAREALGYGELLAHLAGACTLDDAVEAIKIRTRRYAKQQRTWLRRFRSLPRATWIDAGALPPEEWCGHILASHAYVRAQARTA